MDKITVFLPPMQVFNEKNYRKHDNCIYDNYIHNNYVYDNHR